MKRSILEKKQMSYIKCTIYKVNICIICLYFSVSLLSKLNKNKILYMLSIFYITISFNEKL